MSKSEKEWFEEWFDDTYLLLYRHRDQAEAERLVHWLAGQVENRLKDRRVIDLGCGAGRHARSMSELGWDVTGIDLSCPMLRQAIQADTRIPGDKTKHPVCYVRADLRRLPFSDMSFSIALNAFTSFGYFRSDAEHKQAFQEFARVLKHGGVLILDLLNPETALRDLVPHDVVEEGSMKAVQTRQYNPVERRIEKHVRITHPSGESRDILESVRLFTLDEISELAKFASFDELSWFGDYEGGSFDSSRSERMIMLAWKR